MIPGGDIGGTHTRLAVFDDDGRRPAGAPKHTYPSREHDGLIVIVRRFLEETGVHVGAACFGVAGPVKNGRSVATNLPWIIDAAELARELGARAWVINDLEATAWGIAALGPDELAELSPGAPDAAGNIAVVAAGTGLGEAGVVLGGPPHHPFPTPGRPAGPAPHADGSAAPAARVA